MLYPYSYIVKYGKLGGFMDSTEAYQKCLERLIWATQNLNIEVQESQLVEVAELIVQPMTGPWRFFHTPQHIFDVGGNDDPIEIIASLFHDLVYVQVDHSINLNVSYYIVPFTKEFKGQLVIREQHQLPKDFLFDMVASIFDFIPGQLLNPFLGQNEFLSALVAVKALSSFFAHQYLFQIAACIEATIPFRPKSINGLSVSDRLYKRLQITNQTFNLDLSDQELQETVKKGVRIANRDVSSFANPSPAYFLANTWNLLPETNHNLTVCNTYTVLDYRLAIQKMEGFMSILTPELIFRKYQNEPNEERYQAFLDGAKKNLEIAQLYLGTKLVTISLIEALSFTLGLDIPLATMMGEMPTRGFSFIRLENFLPTISKPHISRNNLEENVLFLLEKGRAKGGNHDLQNSPLAAFLANSLGFEEISRLIHLAKKFIQGSYSADEFIANFSPEIIANIIDGILELFDSRKSSIKRFYKGDKSNNING